MSAHFSQVLGTLSLNNSKMSLGLVSGGNLQRFVRTTYRPAGLLSIEMSKKVRFPTMVTAYGQLGWRNDSERSCAYFSAYLTGTGQTTQGCDL